MKDVFNTFYWTLPTHLCGLPPFSKTPFPGGVPHQPVLCLSISEATSVSKRTITMSGSLITVSIAKAHDCQLAVGFWQLLSSSDPSADSEDSYPYCVHIEVNVQLASHLLHFRWPLQ